MIRFDHDFVGRDALEEMQKQRHRRKVSLVFDRDDAAAVYRSQMEPGFNGKGMEMPLGHYASYPYDTVLDDDGNQVGVSTYTAFLAPDGAWVSIAIVDEGFAAEGQELVVVWGEPNGGSNRPTVEPHKQMRMRATVTKWPFSKAAKEGYRTAELAAS